MYYYISIRGGVYLNISRQRAYRNIIILFSLQRYLAFPYASNIIRSPLRRANLNEGTLKHISGKKKKKNRIQMSFVLRLALAVPLLFSFFFASSTLARIYMLSAPDQCA